MEFLYKCEGVVLYKKILLKMSGLADDDVKIVEMVARCVPHIIPNVLLAKRQVSGHRSHNVLPYNIFFLDLF